MGTVTDTITNVLILISIVLMGIITYRESSKEIAVLRRRLMETDNTVRSLRDTNSRLNYLEWRLNHPEITFSKFTDDEQGMIVENDGNIVGGVTPVWTIVGSEVIGAEFKVWGNPDLRFEYLNDLKASLEKYGAQLFK